MMKAPLIRLCSLLIFFGVSVVHAQTQERIVKLTFDQAPTEDSPWFYHRMTTARRTAKLTENGGSGTTERSVLAALRWLKNKQAPDGSWPGGTSEGAATGLATLAFLGHGETPASPEFGTTVSRAREWNGLRRFDQAE